MRTKTKQLERLMADHGYRFNGRDIVAKAVRGWTSDRIVGRARDAFDAAEQLCPIISENEYTERLSEIIRESIQ